MSRPAHLKRNADITYRVLVLGRMPARVAEEEGLSPPRVNQIVTEYCWRVLHIPITIRRIADLREYAYVHCTLADELVPLERGL